MTIGAPRSGYTDGPSLERSRRRLATGDHFTIGRGLATLRDEGILVMRSDNTIHNMHLAFMAERQGPMATPERARSFDEEVTRAMAGPETTAPARAVDSDAGRVAHPNPDRNLPLPCTTRASGPRIWRALGPLRMNGSPAHAAPQCAAA